MPVTSSTQALLYPSLLAYLAANVQATEGAIDWEYDSDAFSPNDMPKGLIGIPHDRYDEQSFFDLTYTPIEWRVVVRLLLGDTTRTGIIAKVSDWNSALVKAFRTLKFGGIVYEGAELWADVDIEDHPAPDLRKNEGDGYVAEIQFVLSWRDDGKVIER